MMTHSYVLHAQKDNGRIDICILIKKMTHLLSNLFDTMT